MTSQEGTIRVGSQVVHLRVRSRTSKEDRKAVVALLGGTFDPITDGHLKMAAEVIHSGLADIVWIVPCGPRAGTSKPLVLFVSFLLLHRFNVVQWCSMVLECF